jgi:cell division protein FtsB
MKRFVFFILFLSLLVSFGNEGWFKLYRLKQFERMLQKKNELLVQNNAALLKEIRNLKDPRYLEHYIREELGYLKDDEVLYEFSQEAAATQSP